MDVVGDVPKHDHIIDTGKSALTLDELGHVQPGLARIMPEIGLRIWKCFYAGKSRNQALARFQLSEAVNLLEIGAFLRPKYGADIATFIQEDVDRVKQAIETADWEGFESAFHRMVEAANAYHELHNKGFLRWKIPDQPPPDLDMTPRN